MGRTLHHLRHSAIRYLFGRIGISRIAWHQTYLVSGLTRYIVTDSVTIIRVALRVYNPDLPTGAPLGLNPSIPPAGFISNSSAFPLRSLLTIMAFSQMDVVAS